MLKTKWLSWKERSEISFPFLSSIITSVFNLSPFKAWLNVILPKAKLALQPKKLTKVLIQHIGCKYLIWEIVTEKLWKREIFVLNKQIELVETQKTKDCIFEYSVFFWIYRITCRFALKVIKPSMSVINFCLCAFSAYNG